MYGCVFCLTLQFPFVWSCGEAASSHQRDTFVCLLQSTGAVVPNVNRRLSILSFWNQFYRLLLEQYKGGLVGLAGADDHCIEGFYGVFRGVSSFYWILRSCLNDASSLLQELSESSAVLDTNRHCLSVVPCCPLSAEFNCQTILKIVHSVSTKRQ